MAFINLPPSSGLTLDLTSFMSANPSLAGMVVGHALAHSIYSYVRSGRRHGLNRRQTRKKNNRKRRWFVDNIIMHHKRLHDKNRETIVNKARQKVLARHQMLRKGTLDNTLNPSKAKDKEESMTWRNKVSTKDRGIALRDRVETRRLRGDLI